MSESLRLPHPPLSLIEARILGCLCEKEVTTPDNYPLTLNALTNACNQKSNRHPVLELDEGAVDTALESLRGKRLAFRVSQADARVAKFKHSLDLVYPIADDERAILAELLLRGPQTVGELRGRCERLGLKANLERAHALVEQMTQGDFPLVKELPRQAGKKDVRYAHLLSGEPDQDAFAPDAAGGPMRVEVAVALPPEAEARIAELESAVAALRAEFAAFRQQFE